MVSGNFHFSISGDMVYLERYAFKLSFENEVGGKYKIILNEVDITTYLEMQLGRELYFTSGTFPSIELEKDFDLLLVVSDMQLVNDENWKKIIEPGLKTLTVVRENDNENDIIITIHKYIKYSHLNR